MYVSIYLCITLSLDRSLCIQAYYYTRMRWAHSKKMAFFVHIIYLNVNDGRHIGRFSHMIQSFKDICIYIRAQCTLKNVSMKFYIHVCIYIYIYIVWSIDFRFFIMIYIYIYMFDLGHLTCDAFEAKCNCNGLYKCRVLGHWPRFIQWGFTADFARIRSTTRNAFTIESGQGIYIYVSLYVSVCVL
jgi:hypothetical protein